MGDEDEGQGPKMQATTQTEVVSRNISRTPR
jgi:hypothetical protein